jgi:hypothetical protein
MSTVFTCISKILTSGQHSRKTVLWTSEPDFSTGSAEWIAGRKSLNLPE